jgi:hypothetical protein
MATNYHLPESIASPVTGRFLAHNRYSHVERAFLAADLYLGAKRLTRPTLLQAAALGRVSRTYVQLAANPRAQQARADIEAGCVPLVPVRGANGHDSRPTINAIKALHRALLSIPILDSDLVTLVRSVGVDRVLDAAVAAEAAQ